MTLLDVWVLNHELFRYPARTACWVPIDHEPLPPMIEEFFDATDAVPIAMSRFGERALQRFDPLYVPHGVDLEVFRPLDRREARAKLGLPGDKFIVGMVAANKGNPSRKAFSEAIEAFARLLQSKDDRAKGAHLYLHTEASGAAEGVALVPLLQRLGIPPERVHFPDQYQLQCTGFDDEHMARLFSAFDVLLNPSFGEGFGIPMIEAQACGTPVITSDFSACPEVGEVGWHVGGTRFWTYQHSFQQRPNVDEIVWALGEAAQGTDRMRDAARVHAAKYGLDAVVSQMASALSEAWVRCQDREPVTLKAAA